MKITNILLSGVFTVVLFAGALLPTPASALSCLSPIEYIPMIVEEGERTIFRGEITETVATDGNVTQLEIDVIEVLQGEAADTVTVEYEYDDTWGYLCAGAPGAVGATETFIIRDGDVNPYVVFTITADSDLNEVLSNALAGSPTTPVATGTPSEGETVRNLMFQVIELLEELFSLLQLR
jgi:hypothetical protein